MNALPAVRFRGPVVLQPGPLGLPVIRGMQRPEQDPHKRSGCGAKSDIGFFVTTVIGFTVSRLLIKKAVLSACTGVLLRRPSLWVLRRRGDTIFELRKGSYNTM